MSAGKFHDASRRGRETAAFEISERLRGQEMLELLAEGRLAVTPPTDTALVAKEQDLRYRIAALERTLEEQHGRDPVRVFGFRADAAGFIAETEGLFAALGQRVQRENTELYTLVDAVA